MEVFMVDIVREVFVARRDLFRSGRKIELVHGDILSMNGISGVWTKLLNGEARRIQGRSFDWVRKYFDKRFEIDFNSFSVDFHKLEEITDRRHILVHRLGQADEVYQRKYNTNENFLPVKEEYFLEALNAIQSFADELAFGAQELVNQGGEAGDPRDVNTVEFCIRPFTELGHRAVDPDFTFVRFDRVINLKDVLISITFEGNTYIVLVSGKRDHTLGYTRTLERLERQDHLEIISLDVSRS
jgi:hypothetical protein